MDFEFQNHGSVCMLRPITDAAKEWVDANLELEGWQWMGPSFAVEPRCADALIDGIIGDGLTVG